MLGVSFGLAMCWRPRHKPSSFPFCLNSKLNLQKQKWKGSIIVSFCCFHACFHNCNNPCNVPVDCSVQIEVFLFYFVFVFRREGVI